MSYVHVFVVKGEMVYRTIVHWRAMERLFERGVEAALPMMRFSFIDAGYVIVDCNKNMVINGQSASKLDSLRKKDIFILEA